MKKQKIIDFIVLALRWYLVFYMISYGWSKLTMSQFGVHDASILEKSLKDVDSFYVAWHLFSRSTFFNISTGILEIIGGILLIFNRTTLLGALLVLTILGQILVIDIAFTTGIHGYNLPFRIGGMMLADILILYYYKEKVLLAWNTLTSGIHTKFKYKWWMYLILPIVGFLMDFVFSIFSLPFRLFLNWITN